MIQARVQELEFHGRAASEARDAANVDEPLDPETDENDDLVEKRMM